MNDAALLCAFIEVESAWNEHAYLADHNGGSYGLLQIDLPTAQDRGYTGDGAGLFDAANSVRYGVRHLNWIINNLTKRNMYSVENLAAAYNSGLQHVLDGGTDLPYSAKIQSAYAKWLAFFPS